LQSWNAACRFLSPFVYSENEIFRGLAAAFAFPVSNTLSNERKCGGAAAQPKIRFAADINSVSFGSAATKIRVFETDFKLSAIVPEKQKYQVFSDI